jgi:hypothetical protein
MADMDMTRKLIAAMDGIRAELKGIRTAVETIAATSPSPGNPSAGVRIPSGQTGPARPVSAFSDDEVRVLKRVAAENKTY